MKMDRFDVLRSSTETPNDGWWPGGAPLGIDLDRNTLPSDASLPSGTAREHHASRTKHLLRQGEICQRLALAPCKRNADPWQVLMPPADQKCATVTDQLAMSCTNRTLATDLSLPA
jgi:hypothetical protein